jgi:hypothetical protein
MVQDATVALSSITMSAATAQSRASVEPDMRIKATATRTPYAAAGSTRRA